MDQRHSELIWEELERAGKSWKELERAAENALVVVITCGGSVLGDGAKERVLF